MKPAYRYRAEIVRVIDGDTLVADLDLGCGVWKRKEHIRFLGLNAPELNTADGVLCKLALEGWVYLADQFVIETKKDRTGKYGRLLGRVWGLVDNDWHDFNSWMTEKIAELSKSRKEVEDVGRA